MRHKRLFSHVYLSSSSVDVYPRSVASRTTKRRVGASAAETNANASADAETVAAAADFVPSLFK